MKAGAHSDGTKRVAHAIAKKAMSKVDDVKTDTVGLDTDATNVVAHTVIVNPKDTTASTTAVAAVNAKDQGTAQAQRSQAGTDKLTASEHVDVASAMKLKVFMTVEKKTADSVCSKVGAHLNEAKKKDGLVGDTTQTQTEAKESLADPVSNGDL